MERTTLKKDERCLGLRPWEYNVACILQRIREIVTQNGGRIVVSHKSLIGQRHLIRNRGDLDDGTALVVNHLNQINFVTSDKMLCQVIIDRNPFFDFYYAKIPVTEHLTYSGEYYCSKLDRGWIVNDIFERSLSDEELTSAANMILGFLRAQNISEREKTKVTLNVPNLYNGDMHSEVLEHTTLQVTRVYPDNMTE